MHTIEREQANASKRLAFVEALLENALETYENDPSEANRTALQAAQRLGEEEVAKHEEWHA